MYENINIGYIEINAFDKGQYWADILFYTDIYQKTHELSEHLDYF